VFATGRAFLGASTPQYMNPTSASNSPVENVSTAVLLPFACNIRFAVFSDVAPGITETFTLHAAPATAPVSFSVISSTSCTLSGATTFCTTATPYAAPANTVFNVTMVPTGGATPNPQRFNLTVWCE
jgi:hypothetical protein